MSPLKLVPVDILTENAPGLEQRLPGMSRESKGIIKKALLCVYVKRLSIKCGAGNHP